MNQIPVTSVANDEEFTILDIVAKLQHKPGALLPILHAIQEELGFVPEQAKSLIAARLNLTRAEVHGVVSFYHFFRNKPGGKHTFYICRAEACKSSGGIELEAEIKQWLGIDYHQTDKSGEIELLPVYCLGQCATAPSVRLNDDVFSRMTLSKAIRVLQKHTNLQTEASA